MWIFGEFRTHEAVLRCLHLPKWVSAIAGLFAGTTCEYWQMEKEFCVYILASRRNGTLYVGVTSNLVQRVWQHREGVLPGFSKRYDVKCLVWYEQHENAESAIVREKQIKKWNRQWKVDLIERSNPYWNDLYFEITD